MSKAVAAIAAAAVIAVVVSILWELAERARQPAARSGHPGAQEALSDGRLQRSWPYYGETCADDRMPAADRTYPVRIVFVDRLQAGKRAAQIAER